MNLRTLCQLSASLHLPRPEKFRNSVLFIRSGRRTAYTRVLLWFGDWVNADLWVGAGQPVGRMGQFEAVGSASSWDTLAPAEVVRDRCDACESLGVVRSLADTESDRPTKDFRIQSQVTRVRPRPLPFRLPYTLNIFFAARRAGEGARPTELCSVCVVCTHHCMHERVYVTKKWIVGWVVMATSRRPCHWY